MERREERSELVLGKGRLENMRRRAGGWREDTSEMCPRGREGSERAWERGDGEGRRELFCEREGGERV